jgi:hypothetical protein
MSGEALEFEVTLEEQEDGPDEKLRARFAVCASRRLAKQAAEAYPKSGSQFDILDAFEGKFVWEMSQAEMEQNPPSSVEMEIVSIEPASAPTSGKVRVLARVLF